MSRFNILYAILCIVLCAGCTGINFTQWHFPYMHDVQQGNYLTESQITKLYAAKNLTKDDVSRIIGYPMNQFMFDKYQWNYIFQDYHNNILTRSYSIDIVFDKQDRVIKIESSLAQEVFAK